MAYQDLGLLFDGVSTQALALWWPQIEIAVFEASSGDPSIDLYAGWTYTNVKDGTWAPYGNSGALETDIRAIWNQTWNISGTVYEENYYSSAHTTQTSTPPRVIPTDHKLRTEKFWTTSMKCPAAAQATDYGGSESRLCVLHENKRWALDCMSSIRMDDGDLVASFSSFVDIFGMGDYRANGRCAAMLPYLGGLIRDGEITDGAIKHALAFNCGTDIMEYASVSYPAGAHDSNATGYGTTSRTLPMGSRLALDSGLDIDSLSLGTNVGTIIATACQDYGCFLVDNSGADTFVFSTAHDCTDIPTAWHSATWTDIGKIMDALKLVSHDW